MFKSATLCFLAGFMSTQMAMAEAKVNEPAPTFTATDALGKTVKLADFADKTVILEWYNKDCPYVKKHYGKDNMQKLQRAAHAQKFVWLTVLSSAKGKEGYLDPKAALENAKKNNSFPDHILMDSSGALGKLYGAKTTPHMFVVNPKGILAYNGAIDNNDSADPKTIDTAKNYVLAALASASKGEPVAENTTKPYGCSVKYQ